MFLASSFWLANSLHCDTLCYSKLSHRLTAKPVSLSTCGYQVSWAVQTLFFIPLIWKMHISRRASHARVRRRDCISRGHFIWCCGGRGRSGCVCSSMYVVVSLWDSSQGFCANVSICRWNEWQRPSRFSYSSRVSRVAWCLNWPMELHATGWSHLEGDIGLWQCVATGTKLNCSLWHVYSEMSQMISEWLPPLSLTASNMLLCPSHLCFRAVFALIFPLMCVCACAIVFWPFSWGFVLTLSWLSDFGHHFFFFSSLWHAS